MPIKTIGKFAMTYMRILDEKGQVDEKLEPELSNPQLTKLYRAMYTARQLDNRMLKMQRQGRLGTIPVCTGQEACVCASTLALRDTDWFAGSYRELGGRLMRGEPLINPLIYYNGYEEGSVNPVNDRTLPLNIVLGSQLPHVVGLTYAARMKGEKDTAAIVFFGEGSSSEGDFHEAVNFAAVWNLPVVFFCQNNQWAISTPRAAQTRAESIAQKAIGYGIHGIQIDGNDSLAVYKATKDALDRGRAGEGPSLIEAITYRMGVHTTADDPTRYRDKSEVEEWMKKDPITRFEKYLLNKKVWSARKQKTMEDEINTEIDQTVKTFESMTDYKPDTPFDYIFGTENADIEEQRAEFLRDHVKVTENA